MIAKAENINMTPEHWEVVDFLREYYEEYQIAPAIRILVKEMKKKFGPEKGDQKALYELFPYGRQSKPAKSPACRSRRAAFKGRALLNMGRKTPSPLPSPQGERESRPQPLRRRRLSPWGEGQGEGVFGRYQRRQAHIKIRKRNT